MRLTNRLAALEKPSKVVYPAFKDMIETSTKRRFNDAMIKLNPNMAKNEIESLHIVHIEDMYS